MSKDTEGYPELPDFEKLPPVNYDAVYENIHDWAQDRTVEDTEYSSAAKDPVIPFAPLTREIGVSPVEDVETREMTLDYQQQISNWVGLVKSPFDLIQRAEGLETPQFVYYAGQKRAAKNTENLHDRAVLLSSSGRAGVRRQYDTTFEHHKIAKDRVEKATAGLTRLKNGEEFTEDDRAVTLEILQELANGVAANLDNKFNGGDIEARIAGNSILDVAKRIEERTVDPLTQRRLLYAAVGYVRKQEKFWNNKLKLIFNFAAEKNFTVGQQRQDAVN
jgi:hypothetical protein